MVELLQQLLLKHNCVIIPNFGAFIGNYNPAEVRLMESRILPPNKIIAFNRTLQKNDGLLMNAVALHFSISYHEAEMKVTAFSRQCTDSLSENRSLVLNGIGRLLADQENNIHFHPYLAVNYLLDAYGLPIMSLHPIQRLKDSESAVKETYQRVLHPELLADSVSPVRKSSNRAYWAAAVLAIVFLASSLTWNIQKGKQYQSESSLVPVFTPAPTVVAPEKVEEPAIEILQEVNTPVLASTPATVPVPAPVIAKSYIVIGAFFDETRAGKFKAEAERKGYTVNITKDSSNGLLRATVEVNEGELENTLLRVKSDINQRAWIYCVKCSL